MIWQDSEIYHAPARDLLPEPLQLDELNLQNEMHIYLALPILQANKHNVSHEASKLNPVRYHSHLTQVHDLFTDAATADITLLRKRGAEFKLLAHHASPDTDLDGFYTLPIGKLKRHSTGNFELDNRFIPPILHISANETCSII